MKKIFLIILIIQFFSCAKSQKTLKKEKSGIQVMELNGNVKSLESKVFNAVEKFGKPVKINLEEWTINHFDKKGNIIIYNSLSEKGILKTSITYGYDKKNNLIKEIYKVGFGFDYAIYNYDKNLNNIELTYFSKEKIFAKHTKKFDLNNNEIEYKIYDGEGNLSSKDLNKYEDNMLVEKRQFQFDGESCSYYGKRTFEYDFDGNLEKDNYFDNKDNFEFYYKFTYDDKGNLIEKLLAKDNTETKEVRKINKYGNCYEEQEFLNGILKNNYKKLYKYDTKGNWIEKLSYNNEVLKHIEIRKIEYFN